MNDVIITLIVFILLLLISFTAILFIRKRTDHRMSIVPRILICVSCFILSIIISSSVYFSIYYHADEQAQSSLESTDSCSVLKTDDFYLFDGPGTAKAMIFYPGAKVEAESYSPLMKKISSKGIDCFLVKMPLNFALIGKDRASKIIDEYSYESFIISGHSLGGAAASMYASQNTDRISGLVLFASYSTEKIDTSVDVLSIFGSNDEILNKESYDKNIFNLPQAFSEHIIEGGNHAGFGNYGSQKGDGNADISSDEQQEISAETISSVFLNNE